MSADDFSPILDHVEAAIGSAHAAQLAALDALRRVAELTPEAVPTLPATMTGALEVDGLSTGQMVFSVEEAAQLLGIGRNRAYSAAKSGELPTISLGRRRLVPRPALVALLHGMSGLQYSALIERRIAAEIEGRNV